MKERERDMHFCTKQEGVRVDMNSQKKINSTLIFKQQEKQWKTSKIFKNLSSRAGI
jgi:hypothetical protein